MLYTATPQGAKIIIVCQIYGMASIVSGMAAIWSLTILTLERALVISRAGYLGARKQTMR